MRNNYLHKRLDQLVRDYLHNKYPNPKCFVCGKVFGWQSQTNRVGCQIGHYIRRGVYQTRWDLWNVYPQCVKDNAIHNHNPEPFKQAIIREYGQDRIDYLERKRPVLTMSDKLKLLNKLLVLTGC